MSAQEFLKKFKKAAKESGLDIIPTQKNRNAIIDLGITKKIRKEIIFKLKNKNYHSGPTPDRDKPGDIWVFREEYDGIEIYIKLKLSTKEYGDKAKCLSFHRARYLMDKKIKKA